MIQLKPTPGAALLSAASSAEPCDPHGQAIQEDRKIDDWLTKKNGRTNVETAPSPFLKKWTNVEMAPYWQKVVPSSVRVTSSKISQLKPRKWTKLINATDRDLKSCSNKHSCRAEELHGASMRLECLLVYLKAFSARVHLRFIETYKKILFI